MVVGTAEEGGRGVPKGMVEGLLALPPRPPNETPNNPPCNRCCLLPTVGEDIQGMNNIVLQHRHIHFKNMHDKD